MVMQWPTPAIKASRTNIPNVAVENIHFGIPGESGTG